MKKRITTYTFDASAGTIAFGFIPELEGFLLITNVVDNVIIYNFADTTLGGSVTDSTLSLDYDTASMSDTDELMIMYDDGETTQVVDLGATDNEVLDAIETATEAIQAGQLADGHNVTVDNASLTVDTGLTQPLTDTELRLTPVSVTESSPLDISALATSANQLPDGHNVTIDNVSLDVDTGLAQPLTDTELRATAVPVSGDFYQATQPVEATNLDIRDLDSTSDGVAIYGSDDGGTTKRLIKTDSGGAIQVDLEVSSVTVDDVTIDNEGGASAVNIQDGGNSLTVDGSLTVDLGANNDVTVTSGSVTANAGTNLNTSALALEAGGNLADIKTNTDNIPALGQALAAASVPVILPAATITTLTPPAAITGFATSAKQLADNHQVTVSNIASTPVITGFATSAKQDTIIGHIDGIEGSIDGVETLLGTIDTDTSNVSTKIDTLAGAVAGTEVQVDVLTMPTTTVQATNLDVRDLTNASDSVAIYGSDDGGTTKRIIKTDAGGAIQMDIEVASVTANAGTNLNTSALALETGGNLASIKTNTDDIETLLTTIEGNQLPDGHNVTVDNASIAVTGAFYQATQPVSGTVTANLGATDNAVLDDIASDTEAIKTSLAGTITVTGGGGGTEYTEGDIDATITGGVAMMEGADNTALPIQGTVANGLLVNLGSNNDVTVTGSVTADLGANNDVTVTGTVDLGATDNAVLDTIAAKDFATQTTLSAINAKMVTGTDIGDVTINNSTGAAAVNIQDGGNAITVDGAVTVDMGANNDVTVTSGAITETNSGAIKTAVELIDNAISGSEMQVDIVGSLPAGTAAIGKLAANSGVDIGDVTLTAGSAAIGKLAANSGVDIGDVDVASIAAGTNIIGKIGHDITGIGHGVKTVTTAGTDLALAASTACKKVDIQAQTDNTGRIAVGGSGVDATVATGTGIILEAGDVYSLEIDNLADVYIDSSVNGEGVRFTYFT